MIRQKKYELICTLFVLLLPNLSGAVNKNESGGWEKGSRYNAYYKADETDSFKGEIVEILEVVPLKGMSPGLALSVKESPEETILVHVCPLWYSNAQKIGIKKGDQIKIKGAWAEIDGREVFMASKLKKGDFWEFKVRLTKDGTPFWDMSSEELSKEKKQE